MGMVLENGVWVLKSDSPWTVEYEVDFAREASHDFRNGDGDSVDINGVTWYAAANDLAAETKFEITNGVGLEIDALTSSGNNWYNNGRKAPVLSAKVSHLVSNLSTDDTIAFQLAMSGNTLVNNWQAFGMGLYDGSGTVQGDTNPADGTPNAQGMVVARNFYESELTMGCIRADAQDKYDTEEQADYFEIIWYPACSCYVACGTWPGEFKDPRVIYTYQGYLVFPSGGWNMGSDSSESTAGLPDWGIHRPDDGNDPAEDQGVIGISASSQYQSSGGAATTTTTATNFRVLRARKN